MKITIIGAGPVGCYAAYLFAQSNHDVTIYDQKSNLGLPVQCTGILTTDFNKFSLPLESFLLNKISNIKISTVDQETTLEQQDYIICREKFDNYLANLALKAGAKIFLSHSFLRKENNNIIIKDITNNEEKVVTSDLIIAADGPLSSVSKAYNLYQPKKYYSGIQAVVEGNFDPNSYQTIFGNDICPELFAWIVPESEKLARVGLATTKNSRKHFDNLINKYNFKIKHLQAGTIPLYDPKQKLFKDNCYLLGDAASFVKATTLGGIIPGMEQAQILVNSINNKENYLKNLKPLKRKLSLHLTIRKILNKFSDQDWDKLIQLMSQDKIKSILKKHTREEPLPILTKTLIREPRFLYFIKYLF